jgi:hypothetical protein
LHAFLLWIFRLFWSNLNFRVKIFVAYPWYHDLLIFFLQNNIH